MSKKIKNVVVILSAIALVISSVTIYHGNVVGAVASTDELTSTEITADKEVISVHGFQIQANADYDENGVNFRTVCKSLNIGETFQVDEESYTVQAYGTVYALDYSNTSGDHSKDVLDVAHTLLNTPLDVDPNGSPCYKHTLGKDNVTYGYEATSLGVVDGWDELDDIHTYYSRTMYGMDKNMANSIYVRAFIIAKDSKNETVFVYSKDTATISVAEIAEYLYEHNMAKNDIAHKYLFDKILNTEILRNAGHKSYKDEAHAKDYGWDDNLYRKGTELVLPNNN